MNLEIEQEGKGPIEIFQEIPRDWQSHIIAEAIPVGLRGDNFQALMQEFKGDGFSAWYTRYWMKAPVVLKARADIPVLELRITLLNLIRGTWDKIPNAALPMYHFQMGFVPHILTRAIFDAAVEYATFDIHFQLPFLQRMGLNYQSLDRFIKKVESKHAVELSKYPYYCTPRMLDGVRAILHNNYSSQGKVHLLENEVRGILLAALEEIGKGEIIPPLVKPSDIDKLYAAKALIEADCPLWRGTDKLCQATGLNEYTLSVGFRHVFKQTPYERFLEVRFDRAKEKLRNGESVIDVAHSLEYTSASPFIKKFKEKFRYTPKEWQRKLL